MSDDMEKGREKKIKKKQNGLMTSLQTNRPNYFLSFSLWVKE